MKQPIRRSTRRRTSSAKARNRLQVNFGGTRVRQAVDTVARLTQQKTPVVKLSRAIVGGLLRFLVRQETKEAATLPFWLQAFLNQKGAGYARDDWLTTWQVLKGQSASLNLLKDRLWRNIEQVLLGGRTVTARLVAVILSPVKTYRAFWAQHNKYQKLERVTSTELVRLYAENFLWFRLAVCDSLFQLIPKQVRQRLGYNETDDLSDDQDFEMAEVIGAFRFSNHIFILVFFWFDLVCFFFHSSSTGKGSSTDVQS